METLKVKVDPNEGGLNVEITVEGEAKTIGALADGITYTVR
jgi:hypothetical protein